ncbi:MAG: hypothetical protein ACRC9R_05400, partial [Enterovibrio sp.]
VIPLRINGQVLNVSETVRTVTHFIQQVGLIHHVQRTYTVHSHNHAPIQGVTQSDVLNAIRLYDAQQAAQRQQAAGQPARGPHNPPPPPPAAGAAVAVVAPPAAQHIDALQNVMGRIDLEYRQVMSTLLQRDPDRLMKMQQMEKDLVYRAQEVAARTAPSASVTQRLTPFLPLFMAYKSFESARGRVDTQRPAGVQKQAFLQLLDGEIRALGDLGNQNNSQPLKDAASELEKLRERCAVAAP